MVLYRGWVELCLPTGARISSIFTVDFFKYFIPQLPTFFLGRAVPVFEGGVKMRMLDEVFKFLDEEITHESEKGLDFQGRLLVTRAPMDCISDSLFKGTVVDFGTAVSEGGGIGAITDFSTS